MDIKLAVIIGIIGVIVITIILPVLHDTGAYIYVAILLWAYMIYRIIAGKNRVRKADIKQLIPYYVAFLLFSIFDSLITWRLVSTYGIEREINMFAVKLYGYIGSYSFMVFPAIAAPVAFMLSLFILKNSGDLARAKFTLGALMIVYVFVIVNNLSALL